MTRGSSNSPWPENGVKLTAKEGGGDGWADVWKRHHFGWEYKGKKKDLDKAQDQLRQYAVALENPPLLVVCDTDRFIITTNFTNTVQERHELSLEDLRDASKRDLLKAVFSDPNKLKPGKTRQALTEEAAGAFAALATRLRERGNDPERVAHFVNRLVFCMFAEDVDLLPKKMFQRMLEQCEHAPEDFEDNARTLFAAMHAKEAKNRRVGFESVHWFNGGLFDSDAVLPLEKADIQTLLTAAKLDWSEIDPSILGTLFERGLDPDKRSQLGAHYTDRDKIMMIIDPVIKEPLEAEWASAKAEIEAELAKAQTAKSKTARSAARNRAEKVHSAFMEKLAKFRVLDPACGSGNFLYLALLTLKDIEHRANLEAESLGLPRGFPRVGPECVRGIEINPYAAELARVSVWIGEIQWMRKNGFSANTNPVLRPLDTIENADALVVEHLDREDWTEKQWPEADVIVGNPPFLGGKRMRSYLGDNYVDRLRQIFSGRLPKFSDLVCYWFEKGFAALSLKRAGRVGFVSTNSIRGGANRKILERIVDGAKIYNAWADEPWVVDGAAVRVSLICYSLHAENSTLNGSAVEAVWADLTGQSGTSQTDITKAVVLRENAARSFIGFQPSGEFDVDGDTARRFLTAPTNPNGRTNSEILTPYWNSYEIIRRHRDRWIINLNVHDEADASAYELPFEHLSRVVKPARTENNVRNPRDSEWLQDNWWRHWRSRPELFEAVRPLSRMIVTPLVSKHRIFRFSETNITPSNLVVTIARDDDTTFGILHSRFHELWSLRMGTWLGKGNDPRYTPTTTFETFPFPEGLTPDLPAADYAEDPRAQKIAAAAARLNELRENWLNPPDLVRREPEVVAGYPDRILPVDEAAAAVLKKRTLTNLYNQRPAWLDHAHRALDEAVAGAYGWPADLSDDDVLAKLFALNQARAGKA
ncbi:class I SAM-dependent DNA methyltransferase [Maricaulaceae bacterium MS644]